MQEEALPKNECSLRVVLMMMIEILKMMIDELDKVAFSVNGQRVKANLEQKSTEEATVHVFQCCHKEVGGKEARVKAFYGNLQISFLAEVGPQGRRALAANYTREDEGHAIEGRFIIKDVVSKVCTELTTFFLRQL